MNTQLKVAWLAGLLEGEGSFIFGNGTRLVSVEMTDEDVIKRVAHVIEELIGKSLTVRTIYRGGKRQPTYVIRVHGEAAKVVMLLIVRYMGYRRRKRIWQVLNSYKEEKIDLVRALNIIPLERSA